MSNRTPAEVFPPGEFIRDELQARGWTQGDLAQVMGRPEPAINLIINDKRGITPDTATELAGAFGTTPEFWLNLDNAYKLSKVVVRFSEIRERASLFESAPVKEMEKRGWIKTTDSIEGLKLALDSFYAGIDIENFKVAARASTEQGRVTPQQLAWCVRALRLASKIPARPYQPGKISECKENLRSLSAFPEGVSKVPDVLAEFGIRFVVVEHLTGTKIDGAALWLGDGWNKPVVAISARYDRIDWFWHTVCHEVSHIEHKDSIALIDVDLFGDEKRNETVPEIEKRANWEAAEMLIPGEKLESFIIRKRPYFSKVSIIQFANANKIHPGIVAGQLHHRLGTYKTNREMLVKIRDILISRALTDGWGIQVTK
ncbi:MAG TPA: HigA family addiction module antitoxin [Verrucomicrobiae bacterium]|nr:HigA family addiction module antitoxin [Verrucomicrobiae bacterium]